MTDDKIKFTHDMLEALRAKLQTYKRDNNETWKVIAGKIGTAESTLSAFVAGKYAGDNQKLAEEVAKWFVTAETQRELFENQMWKPSFQPTATAKSCQGLYAYAKLGYMVVIMGHPGLGKTESIVDFQRKNSNVYVLTGAPELSTTNSFLLMLLEAMHLSVPGRTGFALSQKIRRVLKERDTPLIIIDEAQHLGERVLEVIRSIHDETKCGVAFVGNMEVTKSIDGDKTARFAQRSSRIAKREIFRSPVGYDIKMMLEAWEVTDSIEIAFLTSIAMRPGGGALRQMSRVLELATWMARGEKAKRDLRYIKEAADDLQRGAAA
ncbi:DNA transposition protein [Asticcacaulis biprosthecium C19]|uniref:DNA transposition protein n=1 Tax=Asticcacaulis biprosthecium C19 TaxID=715226 RepID=F4QGC4_9CAUL|nr:AAA family ATPase [Asticcacaulis biprosthecium]EGF92452.1 DNA transposition protein [Asticcacaulis biprosthecium C19]